ncbi:MAG: hypothetical protein WBB48_10080 [Thermodesulfobacteriota bacterium]
MSEKETPESVEEQVEEESAELTEEVEASQDNVNEEVEASAEEAEETAPKIPAEKKGLMERRSSFAQSSVPNAHKGYSTTPPVIMLLIVSVFVLLSIIFATAAVIN